MSAITNTLRSFGARGSTYAELAVLVGTTRGAVLQLCQRMRSDGLIVICRARGVAPVTVWLRELAPPGAECRINTAPTSETARAFCVPVKKKPGGVKLDPETPKHAPLGLRYVVGPKVIDRRYAVRLPADYVSELNPNECRGWAKAVAR